MTAYRALPDLLRMGPGAGGTVLAYSHWTRTAHALDDIDWAVLGACLAPATLPQHLARIAREPRVPDPDARIARLVRERLLVPDAELRPFDAAGGADDPAQITHLGIPTRARPELVRRCVESWIERTRAYGRELTYVIADDGRSAAESERTRAAMQAVVRERGGRVLYVGHAERRAHAPLLAREAGVDEALVRHALIPEGGVFGEGGSRNTVLLSAVGTGLVKVDDDTLCAFTPAPGMEDELEICAHDPFFPWFPEPGGRARDIAPARDVDPCALFERLLGRNIAAAAADFPTRWGAAPGLLLRNLREHGGSVAGVMCGILGDGATGSLAHYLLLMGASRERLLRSESVYQHAIDSRQVLMTPTRWTVADIPRCMTYLLALDTRQLVPPFPPVGRNADGLFGVVLRRAFRDAYFGFAPWAVTHDTPPRVSSRELLIETAPRIFSLDLVIRLINRTAPEPRSGDRASSLAGLGSTFRHLAAMAPEEFQEAARVAVLSTRSTDLAIIERALAAYKAEPTWWAADLRAVADRLRHLILLPEHAHPHDLLEKMDAPRAFAFLRDESERYGELLEAWPRVWAAAKRMSDAGEGLAQPL